jgi:hypothetical protein
LAWELAAGQVDFVSGSDRESNPLFARRMGPSNTGAESRSRRKNFSRPGLRPKPDSWPSKLSLQEQQSDAVGSALPGRTFSFPWTTTSSADGIFSFGTGPGPPQPKIQSEGQRLCFDSTDVRENETLSSSSHEPGIASMMERERYDVAMETADQGETDLETISTSVQCIWERGTMR